MSERFLPWFGNDLDTGDYPDVGNGEQPCCMGSAVYGPERCTCWRPVFDHPQNLPMHKGPMRIRPRMCADCAFRPDSPERTGDERFAHSGDGEVDDLVNETFVCHQGLRRLVKWVHPSGAEFDPGPGAYMPPRPVCKADGSPADLCAGWAAEMRRRAKKDKTT